MAAVGEFPLSYEMPKPATLGSEELLGYGLRPTNLLMLDTDLSIRFAAV